MKLIIVFISFMIVSACDVKSEATFNSSSSSMMGTHRVKVKPGAAFTSGSSVTKNGKTKYTFKVGDKNIAIDDEQLIIDGVSYGKLQKNDRVFIEGDLVKVNDVERTSLQKN